MSDSRRLFIGGALATTGALLTGPKVSAGCALQTRILGFGAGFGQGVVTTYSTSIPNWRLGNCELRNATIRLEGPRGAFDAQVCTHFTHSKDIWHFRLQLVSGSAAIPSSQVVVFDQSWDGPHMSELDRPLFHPWHEDFAINPTIDKGKIYARVTSCC